eukprot:1384324-Amorphochlora_amoeboformis.AAC.1
MRAFILPRGVTSYKKDIRKGVSKPYLSLYLSLSRSRSRERDRGITGRAKTRVNSKFSSSFLRDVVRDRMDRYDFGFLCVEYLRKGLGRGEKCGYSDRFARVRGAQAVSVVTDSD